VKRLGLMALATLAGAVLVVGLLRTREAPPEPTDAAPPPLFQAEVELTAAGMEPYRLQVPKDHEVHLLVHAAPDAPEGMLSILGYEDRVAPVGIGPGQGREIVFVADRPGDDFAFSLGGEVQGRLQVTGEHLPEGHR
jgi:hypothetical protein